MKRRSAVTLLLAVALTLSANAASVAASAASWHERRGQAALELVRYPWRELRHEIVFLPARPRYRAMFYPHQRRIEVYVRRGDPLVRTAFDLAHELGHAVDATYLSDEQRRYWRTVRRIERQLPWYGCSGCDDLSTPAGDFAEAFAYWRIRRSEYFASRLRPLPTAVQLRQLDALVEALPTAASTRPAPGDVYGFGEAEMGKDPPQPTQPAIPPVGGWSLWRWAVTLLLQLPAS